ncbi:hypothetical protein M3Y97_01153500 [Aphelenchoides bicaudatus]|nr:hypothetical protein M3Y97_01153500 [Aphelenchoides bicaudatus]
MRLQRFLVLTFCLLTACTHAFPSKPEHGLQSKDPKEPSYLLNKVPKTPAQPTEQDIDFKLLKTFGDKLEQKDQNETESLQDPISSNNDTAGNDSKILEPEQLIQASPCPHSKDKNFKTPCQLKDEQKYNTFWSAIPLYVWILVGIIILCACVIPGLVMCSWCICPCALLCCSHREAPVITVSEV